MQKYILCMTILIVSTYATMCLNECDAMYEQCTSTCKYDRFPAYCSAKCAQASANCEQRCHAKMMDQYRTLATTRNKKPATPAPAPVPAPPSAAYRTPKGGLVPAGVGPFGKTSRYPKTGAEYCTKPFYSYHVAYELNGTATTGEVLCVTKCPPKWLEDTDSAGNNLCVNPVSYNSW